MKKAFILEEKENDIAILYFDIKDEKVNKFSTPVMQELEKTINLLRKKTYKALLFVSKKKDFIVGADVKEIFSIKDYDQAYQAGRRGQQIFDDWSKLPYPTVAVIDGYCMGGGTELSLACTYRLATDHSDTSIAMPEVTLGIIPGWGGCQRLPKLIGIQKALEIILSGKGIDAKKALRLGLVDKIISREWKVDQAISFASDLNQKNHRKKSNLLNTFLEGTNVGKNLIFKQSKKMVIKKTAGHYPAPLKAIEVIAKTYPLPIEEGLVIEARALAKLLISDICKNLTQIFLWTQEIKKESGSKKKSVIPKKIESAAVLGAGVMGGGIAQLFATRRIDVRVKDITDDAVTKAYQQASKILKEKVKRRRLRKEEYTSTILRISGTTSYSGFKNRDLVVEAIVEDLEIKKNVLAELEQKVNAETIIASNTSSLRIDAMASSIKDPARFAGLHFFNPVHRMPLVEIIKGKNTSEETIVSLVQLVKNIKKTPVVVKDGPGFLVNRLLVPYMVEAISLLQEGHEIKKIDHLIKSFGMPMGPIELFDEVGIDVADKVSKILQKDMADRMAQSDILEKMIRAKRYGKKSGQGFYKYHKGKKTYDPTIMKFISVKKATKLSDSDIVERMIFPMINEAARCLKEKIVQSPRDIDIGMIFGTGFAPFRGGLLKFADDTGLKKIHASLDKFTQLFGARFTPSDELKEYAKKGQFYN